MKRIAIDINCDVGEGVGNEKELFPLISSCNIACGGHAGNHKSMTEVVRLAKMHKVNIGAHPSYPDKENFGRMAMDMPPDEFIKSIRKQLKDLFAIVKKENGRLHHIKPHGALYNEVAKNPTHAKVFLEAIAEYRTEAYLYVPYASEIEKEAERLGLQIIYEAFADRNYNADLSLVSRKKPDALILSPETVLSHVVKMARENKVRTLNGEFTKILAETFCVHGDTPLAFQIVSYLTEELPNHNIDIKK